MNGQINYADHWEYQGEVYGVPSTATAQGIVYNKRVFEEAGVTELPKTPEDFIAALKKIKEHDPSIIPLYTNYAAGWTMGSWDDYTGISATGDVNYTNGTLLHEKDPFRDYGDSTHPYTVYKILYDAVAQGLTEDDYSTTDWEGCKGMINRGEIGCMVLGSWAYPQMEAAGDNAADIGYMPFPVTVNGKQYALAGPDYCYGINKNASDDEKQAGIIFVKWMTEQSGFVYNEDGLPIKAGSTETKLSFDNVEFLQEAPAAEGEEDLLNELNSESELNYRAGGDRRIQLIIEHNNLANFETWIFLKWIFKTYVAVTIITHTSDITMAIFDVAQHVVAKAAGVVVSSASITATDAATLMETVNAMSNGSLLGLYLQTGVVMITQFVLSKIIFVIVYARMIEIYLITSLAPIPLATFGNKEQSQIGQNYLRSLAAVAFQGFLIIVCVGIYAVLVHDLAISTDISSSIWGIVGYTVLLCFSLFKTGTLAKSIFSAH